MNHELKARRKEFYSFWMGIDQLYDRWAKAHGLSLDGLFILCAIWSSLEKQEPCTPHRISEEWLMPKQTVSTLLKGMEQKGLLRLEPSEQDRRSKLIRLTPAGESKLQKILPALSGLEERSLNRMTAAERLEMSRRNQQFLCFFQEEMRQELAKAAPEGELC